MTAAAPSRVSSFVSFGVGLVFIATGLAKLISSPMMVAWFERFHLPAWSQYAIGAFEVLGACLVLLRSTRSLGAILLAMDMAGAVLAHILTALDQEFLLLNVGVFAICAWLVLRDPPAFLLPDWEHDPHRHVVAARAQVQLAPRPPER